MFGARLFENLPARPPTPPRDTQTDLLDQGIDQALDFLTDALHDQPSTVYPALATRHSDTPQRTPSSSSDQLADDRVAAAAAASSSGARRVNFAPFVQWDFHNSPVHPPTVQTLPVKPLPPSRSRFSRTSILKPFRMASSPSAAAASKAYSTLQAMLEDAVDALREGSVATRVETYGACLHTLQDVDSFPDTQSLAEHSNQLLHHIRRDVETETTADPNDLKLAVAAIKLLIALIRMPESAAWFDPDRLADALEFSVSLIQTATAPKTILTHHLFFLSQQKFGPRIMTADRVGRTISALTTVHEKVPGNGVRAHRLLIYRRFVEQCPTVMRARAGDWIVNLYTSILSQKRDVREQGIELGYTAALKFGAHADMSRLVQELLDKEFEHKAFGTYALERLHDLLRQRDAGVPRIWAVTVLFLRGRCRRDRYWTWFRPWLELASACVNAGEKQVKMETMVAWRRLVYACMPDLQTIKAVRNLLKAPIEAHLKKETDFGRGLGRSAMVTYFCLLRYSLRPGVAFEHMDSYWDEYVAQLLAKFVSRSDDKVRLGASILQKMFQTQAAVPPVSGLGGDEVQFDFEQPPSLEPRWIRSRLAKVLLTVDDLLVRPVSWAHRNDAERLDSEIEEDDSFALATWSSLMGAVREAGLMEVTTSLDLKRAIAAIVNSLHKLAQAFRQFHLSDFAPARAFAAIVCVTLQRVGAAYFADKMLLRTSGDAFEVAPTPSLRGRAVGALTSPITHLFILQLSLPSGADAISVQVERIRATVMQCWNALKNRNMRLDLLGDLAEALETFKDENGTLSDLQQDVADLLLELAEDTILSSGAHLMSQPSMTASDIAALLRILSHLLSFLTATRIPRLLYAHLVKAARAISGDSGVLLLVTEPQAATLTAWLLPGARPASSEMLLAYATMVIDHDARPRLGSMERARKQIWGGVAAAAAAGGPDKLHDADLVHTNVWHLFDAALRYGYAQLGESLGGVVALTEFVEGMQRHIARSLRSFHTLVRFTQGALAGVLLDEQRRLKDVARTEQGGRLLASILSLWTDITDRYRTDFKAARPASNWLETVQDLLLAGFNSPREAIVNVTIAFWNDFVDIAHDLLLDIDFPDKLVSAAMCLRSIGDVRLPSGYDKENQMPLQHRTLVAFSDYGSQPSTTPLASRRFGPPLHQRLLSPAASKQPHCRTPSTRLTPRRKLRHEDSQLVFEPVPTSSPLRPSNDTDELSQHLTEHQRAVRERQRGQPHAALFRDIASDDAGPARPVVVVHSDMAVASSECECEHEHGAGDETPQPVTPELGPQDGAEEVVVQSSPIAASQSRRRQRSCSAIAGRAEVPSSPPQDDGIVIERDAEEVTNVDEENVLGRKESLPDVILETNDNPIETGHHVANDDNPLEPEQRDLAFDEEMGGYHIASDDLPSSQLVAELLASQSSPRISIEPEEHATQHTSQSSPPPPPPPQSEDAHHSDAQSTNSLLRAQTTLTDLFPASESAASSSAELERSSVSPYRTRSRSRTGVKGTDGAVQVYDVGSLKRKRGRPRNIPESAVAGDTTASETVSQPSTTLWVPAGPSHDKLGSSIATGPESARAERGLSEQPAHVDEHDAVPPTKRRRSHAHPHHHVNAATPPPHSQSAPSAPSASAPAAPAAATPVPALIALHANSNETALHHPPAAAAAAAATAATHTASSVLQRLRALVADAGAVVFAQTDRAELAELVFDLQLAARGGAGCAVDAVLRS